MTRGRRGGTGALEQWTLLGPSLLGRGKGVDCLVLVTPRGGEAKDKRPGVGRGSGALG